MLAAAKAIVVVTVVSATEPCDDLSASDPKYEGAAYAKEALDVCQKSGQGFPANRLFTVYTRPLDYDPFGTVQCDVVSKHQYYLVDQNTKNRYGEKYYLKNTKYNTPHFPACIQDDGTVHPTFVTTCMGRCGAGCGDGEEKDAGLQAIGVGYTSTDLGAGKDAYKRCHVGCWYHDACIYAKLCPKSVQWVDEQGQKVEAPKVALDQCNAPSNPSIIKCGALEYTPLRRTCTDDSPNTAWPTVEDYLNDCVHGRTYQALGWKSRPCGDENRTANVKKKKEDGDKETDGAAGAHLGSMVSVLAFFGITTLFDM